MVKSQRRAYNCRKRNRAGNNGYNQSFENENFQQIFVRRPERAKYSYFFAAVHHVVGNQIYYKQQQ